MKKFYILPAAVIIATGIFAFQTTPLITEYENLENSPNPFSAGHQPGLTGAPGDDNCTMCHTGSVLDGSTQNEFSIVDSAFNVVTSYSPGETYTVTLQLISNPSKKGFSSTVLDDATNSMAGSLTGAGIGGTDDFMNTTMTRTYVSHTITSNTSSTTLWAWTWVAPATNVGDVTFYVASISANDNGTTSGDEIYLSEHTLSSPVGIKKVNSAISSFTTNYNNELNNVNVKFSSSVSGSMYFNLVDLSGRSVYVQDLSNSMIGQNQHSISLPEGINSGIYIVNFFVGNKAMSAKVMIQRY